MKDLKMKIFYRHDVPVNKRKQNNNNNKDVENQNDISEEVEARAQPNLRKTNINKGKEIKGGFQTININDDVYKELEEMNKNLLRG